ncbi:hypothetical protein CUT44_03745 [Streptomyces carminius]|uniref:Antibiotic biosynthesis monooxygenase n=1 Tax=Streptomyces carminius TaxID=2665496 RepID=A0A2M8M614_9ACTN|nr:hypothetical protein [Streptomyces carminius]PJE99626.1 hypothetical protein CUT44_03745 [Streptomyces carminius]
MTFVQLIEYETTRDEEMTGLWDEWLRATEGKRTLSREMHGKDRDRPTHYVDIVEFPSYEEAMRNSELPETRSISERIRGLCEEDPRFVNLEVVAERP